MCVRLTSLLSQVELNVCLGTLVKFDTERERWQVDLGAERGIVLLKTCNLSASKEYEDISHCAEVSGSLARVATSSEPCCRSHAPWSLVESVLQCLIEGQLIRPLDARELNFACTFGWIVPSSARSSR